MDKTAKLLLADIYLTMGRYSVFLFIVFFYKSYAQDRGTATYTKGYYQNRHLFSSSTDYFKVAYRINKKTNLFGSYTFTQINGQPDAALFNDLNFNATNAIDIGIVREFSFAGHWTSKVLINPRLGINKIENALFEDIVFNSQLLIGKKLNKNYSISFGLEYGTLFGTPSVYPLFHFEKAFSEKFRLNIGFPESIIEYKINNSHAMVLNAEYRSDFSRLHQLVYQPVSQPMARYRSLNITRLEIRLQYNYSFFDKSTVSISAGKTFFNTSRIAFDNGETVNNDFNNRFIIEMGFKYNLNFK
ncbi:MAG: hypothetical protein CFE23_08345 [Flavobacterium sp. BFFFF1]|uniref:DUF6268 family outer membrane beta-barrel protein n=1 Tax=Flavobacterium sp. BFFFF1 TaxID=2015557 RepID=UPI000BC406D8|nr:DUF6268 family outer membrane beta-barrel protein [Flavobacterium sp. BFFFF1]OYU80719.1 MAG: hypothetical protein CFE23_08345 [Flavobacterium sp. BFFFF1]